jgi:hypothetical protein
VGTQGQGLWRIRDVRGGQASSVDVVNVEDGLASNAVQSLLEIAKAISGSARSRVCSG